MNDTQLTAADLAQFIGTEQYYRHFTGLRYTDGVKFLAEKAGAYWLIDAIASYQREPAIRGNARLQDFQLWELAVAGNEAVLTLKEDSGCPSIVEQEIEFTDFPLSEVALYVCNGVLMLPSEY